MKFARLTRHLGLAVVAFVVVTACGSTSSGTATCSTAKTATSASACGGMDALVAAAKAEGKLNVIALPRDWANYGAILDGFHAKYGIAITSDNPDGSSQQEVDAIKQLGSTSRGPDVVDSQKEPTGLWIQDYGGFMSIGYDSSKVPEIKSIDDLFGSQFKGKVAL